MGKNNNLVEVEKWLKKCLKQKISITQATVITFLMSGAFFTTGVFAEAVQTVNVDKKVNEKILSEKKSEEELDELQKLSLNSLLTRTRDIAPQESRIARNGVKPQISTYKNTIVGKNAIIGSGMYNRWGKTLMIMDDNGKSYGENSVSLGHEAHGKYSDTVAIGTKAKAYSDGGVAIGILSAVKGTQGVAVGNKSYAGEQATALGNDTIALGMASISLGNDDIYKEKNGRLLYDDKLGEGTMKKIFYNRFC